jgi:UDP-glucose 4-epimerase
MGEYADKAVVTGGAGFIGSHLVDRLLADTHTDIVVFDNMHRGRLSNIEQHRNNSRFRLIHGDIRDREALDEVFRGANIVYHLAAQSSVMGATEDLEYSFSTNVVGTFNVLRSAAEHGVRRVIFTSSREVYGEPIELPVDEAQPLLAINLYGATKVMSEALCRSFRRSHGLHTTILRLANVYGPRDRGRVIPLWLERAAAGEDLLVFGGKQIIDFVWIDQVVDALVSAALIDVSCPSVNVGSGTGTPILQLAKRIAWLSGGHSHVKLLPARSVEVTRFIANVDRMRKLLQVEPPIDPLLHLGGMLMQFTGASTTSVAQPG